MFAPPPSLRNAGIARKENETKMANTTQNPTRLIGGIISSGFVQTGEVRQTEGGEATYTALSGVNVATVIQSGGGRFNGHTVISNLVSGQAVLFVDAVPIATSGMPFAASGHKVVGLIPPVWRVGASGALTTNSQEGIRVRFDTPFFSGLVACPLASGTPSFSCIFTPERSGY